ncbi:MAG TPA: penicillin-binding protein 2 [Chloroflexi bacterium]|nr:penicillin-binding protein 2 [Chloroflexota bacterium]
MNKKSPRLTTIGIIFSLVALMIVFQILRVQNDPVMVAFSEDKTRVSSYLPIKHEAERGRIYDINGKLLAGSKTVYQLGINLAVTENDGRNPNTITQTIMQYFGEEYKLDEAAIFEAASKPFNDQLEGHIYHQFYSLDNIPQSTIDELTALRQYYEENRLRFLENASPKERTRVNELPSLRGLVWTPHLQRYYPEDDLASNILGFATFLNRDGTIGQFGLEGYYNTKLAAEDKISYLALQLYDDFYIEDIPIGQSLILTIDAVVQAEIENILDEAVERYDADSGTIIVMNPKNGEIIAMTTTPRANPNQYWYWQEALGNDVISTQQKNNEADEEGDIEEEVFEDEEAQENTAIVSQNRYNKAIMDTYEPGSVFKVVTMAIALQNEAVQPDTVYDDTGHIEVGYREITNWNQQGMGRLDMGECLRKSSNVCLAWVNTQTGVEKFYEGLHAFGLDRRTNIDLAGETVYPLKEPGTLDWRPVELGRQAYGHGIALTPIQMMMAISAIPNNGRIMAPHVLKSIVVDSMQYNNTPQVFANPISPEIAKTVNDMLIISPDPTETETWNAFVEGYSLCGKTGTALKAIPGGYSDRETNATFVGWGPAEDAKFMVYVWIDNPKTATFASMVSAPVFAEVAEYLLTYYQIPPDEIRLKTVSGEVAP